MKKNTRRFFSRLRRHIESLCCFIIVAFTCSMSAHADERKQLALKDVKIELKLVNKNLKEVFTEIQRKSGFHFIYNENFIAPYKSINISVKGEPVSKILDYILKETVLTYIESKNKVIIVEKVSRPPVSHTSQTKDETISGRITDSRNEPLVGVSVQVKGSLIATSTNQDGYFILNGVPENGTLVVTYVGFVRQEIPINNRSTINIRLEEDVKALDEIVVVGYGTQKKVNLSGAVETIDNTKLVNRPIGNLSQALQGASPGLNVFTNNSGGQPDATMSFNIRGMGTPFVLVDGLPVDINQVNPQDIESISVIKDASAAAIYGANAPYGVILITTKRGGSKDGKPRLSYNNTLTMGTPTQLPHPVNSLDFANTVNDGTVNAGNSPYFSEDVLAKIKQYLADPNSIPAVGPDPIDPSKWAKRENANGNTNWYDEILKPWAFRQKHDLGINGGTDAFNYYVSLGVFDHNGQMRYGDEGFDRYNIDAKVGTRITDWMKVNFLTKFARSNTDYPNDGYGLDRDVMWHDFPRRFPTDPVKYPNGTYSEMSRINVFENGGRESHLNNDFWTKIEAEIEPIKGWQITGDFGWNNKNRMSSLHRAKINAVGPDGNQYIAFDTTPLNSISQTMENNTYWNANIYTSFAKTIANHSFKLLVGHQRESGSYNNLTSARDNLITDVVPSISTATGTLSSDDNLNSWSTMGTFARLNYDYKSKYLLEFNGRYQGSSRFEQESRFGFFPSVSAGYRISEEGFWKPLKAQINSFKIRASYGSLGNHNVPNFLYLPIMPVKSQVSWLSGNEPLVGVSAPGITSSYLTWETVETADIGLDATILNHLDLTFDYFKRTVKDMVGTPNPLPAVLGTNVPQENNAEQENKGWEVSLRWNNAIGKDFRYNLQVGLSDYKTVITKWNNPDRILSQNYVGRTLGEIWGYTSNGLFQSADEITNSATQSRFFANWRPGDVKYEDLNGDGAINPGQNTLENHGDMRVIGNSSPRYLYNFSMGASYKGFDFSALFNGVGKQDVWFAQGANVFWSHVDHVWALNVFDEHMDYYRPGNENGFWPRPYISSETYKNRQPSTRYLQSAAYLRLKYLQVGYTLPARLTNKLAISRTRIFFTGENLLTTSKLINFLDPESIGGSWGQGKTYPLQKTLSLGLNVNF